MLFADFQNSLVESLRARVRNGEITERSLARLVGVSQPHMHNVLKGARMLSPELGDQVLTHLHLSLLDLVDKDVLARRIAHENPESVQYAYVPVLEGSLGPGYPWPKQVVKHERFPIPAAQLRSIDHPVVARLAGDPRMSPVFGDGDTVLLDQSQRARTEIDPKAYYVVRRGFGGLVRRVRLLGKRLFLITEDALDKPAAWEQIALDQQQVQHVIRAKAIFLAREMEWAA
jgi:hypothetical protein